MDLIAYLDIFKRRWILLLCCGALAVVAVLVTMPSKEQLTETRTSYRATATLIAGKGEEATMRPEVMALYTTVGRVPGDRGQDARQGRSASARLDGDGGAAGGDQLTDHHRGRRGTESRSGESVQASSPTRSSSS